MEKNQELLGILFKDFSNQHTITSLAKELKLSRVGMWKSIKKLEERGFVLLKSIGSGKTSVYKISLNWENILVRKNLALYLIEEALEPKRWRVNFAELEEKVDFLI
ncbi:MAG: HTH domain-containing protein, partial [Candidatus Woesearchaeota archaeon]